MDILPRGSSVVLFLPNETVIGFTIEDLKIPMANYTRVDVFDGRYYLRGSNINTVFPSLLALEFEKENYYAGNFGEKKSAVYMADNRIIMWRTKKGYAWKLSGENKTKRIINP